MDVRYARTGLPVTLHLLYVATNATAPPIRLVVLDHTVYLEALVTLQMLRPARCASVSKIAGMPSLHGSAVLSFTREAD